MSSSDRSPVRRLALVAGLLLAVTAMAGCTVRPLYGDVTTSATGPQAAASAKLALVEIAPARDRVGQEVRNHLIFLMAGGKGQPANPAYRLQLSTSVRDARATSVNTRRVNLEPTAGIVTVRGSYVLTDAASGERISAGTRAVQAPYDLPIQEFAALRSVRNAEDRAARELAELLRLVVAQELEKATSTSEARPAATSPEEVEDIWRREDAEEPLLQ